MRSRCGSSAPAASSAFARSSRTRRPTPTRCPCAGRRVDLHGAQRRARQLPQHRRDHLRGRDHRQRGDPPGYGFLAENPYFAEICRACGLTFIGPSPEAIRAHGRQGRRRATSPQAGRAGGAGQRGRRSGRRTRRSRRADAIGYPVILKAAAGGGGRGMRIVRSRGELAAGASPPARPRRGAAFGSSEIYFEKYIERGAARRGAGARRQERQRRAPAASAIARSSGATRSSSRSRPRRCSTPETRARPAQRGAVRGRGGQLRQRRHGRVPGGRDGNFYFIEMNTRIQVEHPVTEMVTGLDLIREQIRIAAGEPLGYRQDAVRFSGHAHRVPDQRRGPRDASPPARAASPPGCRRAASACGWTAT